MKFVPKPLVKTADVSRGRGDLRSRLKGILSAAIILGLGYLVLGWIGLLLAATIPDRWEQNVFGRLPTGLIVRPSADDDAHARAGRLLDRLIQGESLRGLSYRIEVVEMDKPNAFALPGGAIGVSSSLLEKVESEAGLAFVLAHELGHHQHRHLLKSMGRKLLVSLVFSMMFESGAFRGMSSAAAVAEGGFSRKSEREADGFALELVARKLGPSTNTLDFFRQLLREEADPVWQRFLGTHPMTGERLEELERRLEALKEQINPRGPADP